jgi:hypothetical protein
MIMTEIVNLFREKMDHGLLTVVLQWMTFLVEWHFLILGDHGITRLFPAWSSMNSKKFPQSAMPFDGMDY